MTVANLPTFSTPVTVASGVNTYTFGFDAYDLPHVKVQVTASDGTVTVLTYETDYTVAMAEDPNVGGTVTVSATLAVASVVLFRETAKEQTTSLPNQGPYFAETIERELDRQTMVSQEVAGKQTGVSSCRWVPPFQATLAA